MRQSVSDELSDRPRKIRERVARTEERIRRLRNRNFLIMVSVVMLMLLFRFLGKLDFPMLAGADRDSTASANDNPLPRAKEDEARIASAVFAGGDRAKAEILAGSATPETLWVPAAPTEVRVCLVGHAGYAGSPLVVSQSDHQATVVMSLDSLQQYKGCRYSLAATGDLLVRCGALERVVPRR